MADFYSRIGRNLPVESGIQRETPANLPVGSKSCPNTNAALRNLFEAFFDLFSIMQWASTSSFVSKSHLFFFIFRFPFILPSYG
jgi:hypothetical protein